ncbi:GAF domain-containing protein [Duganella sp. S19_KUP01_CR8]|uniref:GAF domain-containing protein n=1 Tax=Duganella sp. S19_KUP01_CR8 TaxID=3025502 RepID=UPI002FCDA47C
MLGLLAAAMVALPTVLFILESNKSVLITQTEAQGIAPVRTVLRLVQLVQQHRGLQAMRLNGFQDVRPEQEAKYAEADRAVATVEGQVHRLDDRSVNVAWQLIREDWFTLSNDITRQSLSAEASFKAHTELIVRLLKLELLIADLFKLRRDPEAETYFLIDAALVRAPALREMLGQLRGAGSGILVERTVSLAQRMLIRSRSDRALDYYDSIDDDLSLAMAGNEALRDTLAEVVQASRNAGAQVLQLAHEQIIAPEQLRYPALEYYRLYSETIDGQYRVSELMFDQLSASLMQRASRLTRIANMLMGAIVLLALLAVVLGWRIVRSVTAPLGVALELARAMTAGAADKIAVTQAIAGGDLTRDLVPAAAPAPAFAPDEIPHDEVGELLRSVLRLNEVQRSLDLAFGQMTAALRANSAAESARDWLKSGLNELSDLMRGEHETGPMAEQVLQCLAHRLQAQVGAFYLYDAAAQQLYLCASYAHTRRKALGERFRLGQGLAGQAALERCCICIDEVPPDYVSIASGLGAAAPRNVSAVPLLHGDTLVGVLELGAFHAFTEAELEFLERARDSIAVGFDANLSRQRMRLVLSGRTAT